MFNKIIVIGGIKVAKKGMRRPDNKMHHEKNEQAPVPEIQGSAKTGNSKAGSVNAPNWAREDYKK